MTNFVVTNNLTQKHMQPLEAGDKVVNYGEFADLPPDVISSAGNVLVDVNNPVDKPAAGAVGEILEGQGFNLADEKKYTGMEEYKK
jgi:hypothetical protein